jgi:hypothetical protein
MMRSFLSRLKGHNKFETAENYSILFIAIGAMFLSFGIGLTTISTKGISAILAIFGALLSFLSTISLIVVWTVKEFKETSSS